MTPATPTQPVKSPFLPLKSALLLAIVAVASFHLAYEVPAFSILIIVFVFCLFRLTHLEIARQAFYFGLGIGLLIYGPQLVFLWNIFGAGAIQLWLVLAFWIALFLVLGRACLVRFGPIALACLAPFLWTGLEYFRSELYYLRFPWLNIGYAFSNAEELPEIAAFGVYGIGFVMMASASLFYLMPAMSKKVRIVCIALLGCALLYPPLQQLRRPATVKTFRVSGVQLEFPSDAEVKSALNDLIAKSPQADLLVLSEYTFTCAIPDTIRAWCREHQKFLAVGGEDPISGSQYYNTVFVIGPTGEVVFKQAKSVPIQFFKDGTPARNQSVWDSPWGLLGFAICYDDGFTRVMDNLVRKGAQALIIPTMDTIDWGARQHELHGRVARMRAAEYRLPVFRVCSSGPSKLISATGQVQASAPIPGSGAIIEGTMDLPARGRVPFDRWIARLSVATTTAICTMLVLTFVRSRKKAQSPRTKK